MFDCSNARFAPQVDHSLKAIALYEQSWQLVEIAEAFGGISQVSRIRGWVTATRKHRQLNCLFSS